MGEPSRQDIDVAVGEDYALELEFTRTDPNDECNELAYDLTNCAILVTVRDGPQRTDTLMFSCSIGSGVTVLDAAAGTARCIFSEAQTELLSYRTTYYYDVWLTTAAGLDKQVVRVSKVKVQDSAGEPA